MKSWLLRLLAILAVTGGIVAGAAAGPVAATPTHGIAAPGHVGCGDCVWHN